MTNEIISKQFYYHPLSDIGFSSQEAAKKDYQKILTQEKREKEKAQKSEELRNYVRLNLESISDLETMLSKNIKDVFGYNFDLKIADLSFGNVSCSHGAPIGKKTNWCGRDKGEPTSYLGWRGSIAGKYHKDKTVSNCLGSWEYNRIKGFHTGCGGGGDTGWHYEFYFFLEDFPKLAKKYKKYSEYKEKLDTEIVQQEIAENQWKMQNQEIYDQINKGHPFEFKRKFSEEELKKLNVGFK